MLRACSFRLANNATALRFRLARVAPFRSGRHRAKRASLSLRSIPVRREPDRSGRQRQLIRKEILISKRVK